MLQSLVWSFKCTHTSHWPHHLKEQLEKKQTNNETEAPVSHLGICLERKVLFLPPPLYDMPTPLKSECFLPPLAFRVHSIQFSSVSQSCLTLCDPMNHSKPGLPVHHQLPEFTQTHVHRVSDRFLYFRLILVSVCCIHVLL